jgi:hypothetical protein
MRPLSKLIDEACSPAERMIVRPAMLLGKVTASLRVGSVLSTQLLAVDH